MYHGLEPRHCNTQQWTSSNSSQDLQLKTGTRQMQDMSYLGQHVHHMWVVSQIFKNLINSVDENAALAPANERYFLCQNRQYNTTQRETFVSKWAPTKYKVIAMWRPCTRVCTREGIPIYLCSSRCGIYLQAG